MGSNCGLKRSMPCSDLISLDGDKEAMSCRYRHVVKEASRLLDEPLKKLMNTSSKRQRLSPSDIMMRDMDYFENPATAALEEALAKDDASFVEHEFLYSNFGFFNEIPKHKMSNNLELLMPSVHSLNELTRVMARITTTTSA